MPLTSCNQISRVVVKIFNNPVYRCGDQSFGDGASPMLLPSGKTAGLMVDTRLSAYFVISSFTASGMLSGEERSCSTFGESGNQARPCT